MKYNLGDIVEVEKKTINPQKTPNDHYCVYSLPGFDNGKTPERLTGSKILSNKIIIDRENYILFNKLNLKFKRVWRFKNDSGNNVCSTEFLPLYTTNNDKADLDYLYYSLINDGFYARLVGQNSGTSNSHQRIHKEDLLSMEIDLPDLEVQQKIVRILSVLDQKIELNNKTNATNKEVIKTIYNRYFGCIQDYCRLDEISTITIGKTPPRNNHECFTKNNNDIKWVSISDLGKTGLYIWDTSEKLTRDAIDRYGIKTVPEGTLVLSFKLTIGRTGITTEEMATNEAIAHIIPKDSKMNHYLYCALTFYNYNELGSTSSIANAINSKIVKSMKIGIPNTETITKFNKATKPLFESVKNNELENNTLIELRDALLPKLMSGEINLDKVALP